MGNRLAGAGFKAAATKQVMVPIHDATAKALAAAGVNVTESLSGSEGESPPRATSPNTTTTSGDPKTSAATLAQGIMDLTTSPSARSVHKAPPPTTISASAVAAAAVLGTTTKKVSALQSGNTEDVTPAIARKIFSAADSDALLQFSSKQAELAQAASRPKSSGGRWWCFMNRSC